MMQYLRADLWRINRRIPRIMAFIFSLGIGIALTISISGQKVFNFVKLGDRMVTTLRYLPILLAIMNLYLVFEDDLSVKTMQTAIGRGMKRFQVIFTKWLEMFLLTLTDCMALTAVMWLTALTKGVTLKGSALTHVAVQVLITCLTFGVMTALIMIIIFQIMSLGITQLVFCILVCKPVSLIMSYIEMKYEIMAKIKFSRFLIGSSLDSFQTSLNAGHFSMGNFAVIFIYWAIGMGITYFLFRKKELDF